MSPAKNLPVSLRFPSCAIVLALLFAAIASPQSHTPASIRDIDFKNFSFAWDDETATPPSDLYTPWHWLDSIPVPRIRVAKGIHHFYLRKQGKFERGRAPLISVDSVIYGHLEADAGDEAVVHLNYSTGGTYNWDYVYVYQLVGDHSKPMGIMKCGSRGSGGLVRADVENGLLVLDFADPERRVGDCCSEGYIRVSYRWHNGAFIEQGPHERGDLKLDKH